MTSPSNCRCDELPTQSNVERSRGNVTIVTRETPHTHIDALRGLRRERTLIGRRRPARLRELELRGLEIGVVLRLRGVIGATATNRQRSFRSIADRRIARTERVTEPRNQVSTRVGRCPSAVGARAAALLHTFFPDARAVLFARPEAVGLDEAVVKRVVARSLLTTRVTFSVDLVGLADAAAAAAILGILLGIGRTHARGPASSVGATGPSGTASARRATRATAAHARSIAAARSGARARRWTTAGAALRISTRSRNAAAGVRATTATAGASHTHFGEAREASVTRAVVASTALGSGLALRGVVRPALVVTRAADRPQHRSSVDHPAQASPEPVRLHATKRSHARCAGARRGVVRGFCHLMGVPS